ncbi:MAG: hypothetical protein ACYDH9_18120 [Limisphaerales bacterium]
MAQNAAVVFSAVWLLVSFMAAAQEAEPPKNVQVRTYLGWTNSLSLASDDAKVKLIVAPAVGGRIARYELKGESIIFENPDSAGKTLANTKGSFWVGGYQCDLGPEIRGIPDHRQLWMGDYEWRAPRDNTVVVTSLPDAALGIRMEKEILLDPENGDVGLTQRMKNISDRETAFCLWDRTLCNGGGFVLFPLRKASRFPASWSIRRTIDGKFVYDGEHPHSPKVKILDGVLVAQADGAATKVGADSDAGWIAYARGRVLLVKFFPVFAGGNYSDGGNSVEAYFDDHVAELEPLSPEVRLHPGESYQFPEKWSLIELKSEVTTFAQARALAKKIPASPFKTSGR